MRRILACVPLVWLGVAVVATASPEPAAQVGADCTAHGKVLKGRVKVVLPDETHELRAGDVIQFDAILLHTYHALADSELILVHQRKAQRF